MTESAVEYTMLVVEDDQHTAELLTYNLEESGFRVVAAGDGEEALDLLREHVVDLIVCDIMLPKMDGFAFRDALLADPALKDIAFLFLTAKNLPEDQIRGLQTGVDEYITKPFDPQVLVARVEAVLARRESFARAARLDPLTQLLNRQAGEREIRRELARVQRYPGTGTLVFLDIDEFKQVNDRFGHAAGDRALIRLAEVLRESTRNVDIIVRYGGEEFVLYFPETDHSAATRVLERMQQNYQEASEKEDGVRLSFSAGVTRVPDDGDAYEVLCGRADSAMYAAKNLGKARIELWHEVVSED